MIQVTETASRKIADIIASANLPNASLRVGIEEGGCSGLSYKLIVDEMQENEDIVLDQGEFSILVHADRVPFIEGLVIDYEEGGMIGGFTMNNPNAKASCGCGASFRMANARGKEKKCD